MSLTQTAEAGLSGIQNMSQRINELALQASTGTLTSEDRQLIQGEISQISQEIDRQAGSTEFNGTPLLNGSFSGSTQIGANPGNVFTLNLSATTAAALGLTGIDVSTQAGAQNAVSVAQGAVNSVATERASIGSTMNRLQLAADTAQVAQENTLASESVIRDSDMALEMIGLAAAQIRSNAGVAALAQGNINRENAARLLG